MIFDFNIKLYDGNGLFMVYVTDSNILCVISIDSMNLLYSKTYSQNIRMLHIHEGNVSILMENLDLLVINLNTHKQLEYKLDLDANEIVNDFFYNTQNNSITLISNGQYIRLDNKIIFELNDEYDHVYLKSNNHKYPIYVFGIIDSDLTYYRFPDKKIIGRIPIDNQNITYIGMFIPIKSESKYFVVCYESDNTLIVKIDHNDEIEWINKQIKISVHCYLELEHELYVYYVDNNYKLYYCQLNTDTGTILWSRQIQTILPILKIVTISDSYICCITPSNKLEIIRNELYLIRSPNICFDEQYIYCTYFTNLDRFGYPNSNGSDVVVYKKSLDNGSIIWSNRDFTKFNSINPSIAHINASIFISYQTMGLNDDSYNISTIKLDEDGNILWIKQYENIGNNENPHVFIDSIGDIYVTFVSHQINHNNIVTVTYDQSGRILNIYQYLDRNNIPKISYINSLCSHNKYYIVYGSDRCINVLLFMDNKQLVYRILDTIKYDYDIGMFDVCVDNVGRIYCCYMFDEHHIKINKYDGSLSESKSIEIQQLGQCFVMIYQSGYIYILLSCNIYYQINSLTLQLISVFHSNHFLNLVQSKLSSYSNAFFLNNCVNKLNK